MVDPGARKTHIELRQVNDIKHGEGHGRENISSVTQARDGDRVVAQAWLIVGDTAVKRPS